MNKKMKMTLRLVVLCLLLCVAVLSFAACGNSTPNANDASGTHGAINWVYTKDNKTLTLTGAGEIANITVDEENDAPWAEVRLSAEKIVLNEGITAVGTYAFWGMDNVKDVILPTSLTEIRDFGFAYCGKITQINFPTSLTVIGQSAFEGCSGMTSLYLPASVTGVGDYAFAYCSGIKNAIITGDPGDGYTFIGAYAFRNCHKLESLVLRAELEPEQVIFNAFEGASKNFESAERTTNPSASSTVTISHVKDGAVMEEQTVVVELEYGKTQTFSPITIDGYTPDPLSLTAAGNGADQALTFTYRKNEVVTESVEAAPAETEPTEEKSGITPSTIVAIVIMAVVLIAIAVGAFLLIRSDKKAAAKNQNFKKNDPKKRK